MSGPESELQLITLFFQCKCRKHVLNDHRSNANFCAFMLDFSISVKQMSSSTCLLASSAALCSLFAHKCRHMHTQWKQKTRGYWSQVPFFSFFPPHWKCSFIKRAHTHTHTFTLSYWHNEQSEEINVSPLTLTGLIISLPQMTYVLLDIAVLELFPELSKVNSWQWGM